MRCRIVIRFAPIAVLALGIWSRPMIARAELVGFEDVGAALSPESYWNGFTVEPEGDHTFSSGSLLFNNHYHTDLIYGFSVPYWDGFAYSNATDTATYGNNNYQHWYNAIPGPNSGGGPGAGGSATYGVGYMGFMGRVPTIEIPQDLAIQSLKVTNTAYAYYAMHDGDAFSYKFGRDDGNYPDWFLLTITGLDLNRQQVAPPVKFHLADYRSVDKYIIDQWTLLNLSSLAAARILEFTLDSSDVDPMWGMNTPAYFAVDDIVVNAVPEPSSLVLLISGAVPLLAWRVLRRRRGAGRCRR